MIFFLPQSSTPELLEPVLWPRTWFFWRRECEINNNNNNNKNNTTTTTTINNIKTTATTRKKKVQRELRTHATHANTATTCVLTVEGKGGTDSFRRRRASGARRDHSSYAASLAYRRGPRWCRIDQLGQQRGHLERPSARQQGTRKRHRVVRRA